MRTRSAVEAAELECEASPWLQGNDVDSLRAINSQLRQCASTTEDMVCSLREFDDKLNGLESLVRPVQEQTIELKHAHTNMCLTMDVMETTIEHFRTATTVAPILRGEGLQSSSFEEYLNAIDRVKDSLDFFRRPVPSCYASASDALRDLERLCDSLGLIETACSHIVFHATRCPVKSCFEYAQVHGRHQSMRGRVHSYH